jgi:hypothetical protein
MGHLKAKNISPRLVGKITTRIHIPTHEAWQLTSPLAHASKHFVSAEVVVGAGADVVPEAAWATAARPMTERIAAENFIVMD